MKVLRNTMKTYVPLKTALQEDDFTVGFKAAIISHLEKEFTVPFSLVITSDVFFEFISYNTLGEQINNLIQTPLPITEQISEFTKLSNNFAQATFPSKILNQLREAYELLCLDANHLEDLTKTSTGASNQIISLQRSTNYEDQDLICQGNVLTRNDFESFLKSIKSIYLSAFSPSSIQFRQKENIKDFSIAIITSRLPEITTCIESLFEEEENKIIVDAYVGFIDKSGRIPRDSFEVAIDFLKINNRKINKQRLVSIFDMEANRPSTKQYLTMNSSQSISEPLILEIARFTKKIQQALQRDRVKIEFIADKHNNLYLNNFFILPKKEELQQTLNESSRNKSITENTIKENPIRVDKEEDLPFIEVYDDDLEKEFENDLKEHDAVFKKNIFSKSTENFTKEIISFLESNKEGSFAVDISHIINSLEEETSKRTLNDALNLCKDIIGSWQ